MAVGLSRGERDVRRQAGGGLARLIHGHGEWPAETRYGSARLFKAEVEGEPILLLLVTRKSREALMTALRIEADEARSERLRAHGSCPDTIRAVGQDLNLPVFTGACRAVGPV